MEQAAGLLLIGVAVVCGGGGSQQGAANLIVELAALCYLALFPGRVANFFRDGPRFLVILTGATLLLPLVQLVPLPAAVSAGLPGHDLVYSSLGLVGREAAWWPISVVPQRTFMGWLALLVPFATLVAFHDVDRKGALRALQLLCLLGVFVAVLGGLQIASNNMLAMPYGEARGGMGLFGTFANHNSSGLFFDLVLVAAAILFATRPMGLALRIAGAAAMLIGVLVVALTQSRSSMGLLLLPAAYLGWSFVRMGGAGKVDRRVLWAGAAICALSGAVVVALLLGNARIAASLGRFDELQDIRLLIWGDSWGLMQRFLPFGAGIGSFADLFQIHESLEYLGPLRAGRAHNDYLEIVIEAGAAGCLLVLAWFVWGLREAFAALRKPSDLATAGYVTMLVALAIQSFVDYPLRNLSLFCVAALAVSLLVARNGDKREGNSQ
ncbi:O-antigen ligase family protein [Novosphingobium profundi]|uniref:O-antigen ligase family protein n=1 Tax=Novosphingobium profundi TaxID=1774954 RepID=UPI001BD9F502|nr:O-antigen ligase family protein [Novosphingobium profundi]MBT0668348.1 O-antigen ligase family protein [Novosphingobium profundi]